MKTCPFYRGPRGPFTCDLPSPHVFKVGDLVRLKSGGPRMTVSDLHEDNKIECRYLHNNGITYYYGHRDTLVKA